MELPSPEIVPPQEIPADLRECFKHLTEFPNLSVMTKAQTFKLISRLRLSEVEKKLCGERLIKFIDAQTRGKTT